MVGAITGTGIEGLRTTDRLAFFTSGVAYPDWAVLSTDILIKGASGTVGRGFFGVDWRLSAADSAWQ